MQIKHSVGAPMQTTKKAFRSKSQSMDFNSSANGSFMVKGVYDIAKLDEEDDVFTSLVHIISVFNASNINPNSAKKGD